MFFRAGRAHDLRERSVRGVSHAGLEALEERRLLATYVVDNIFTDDESDGNTTALDVTLREAIELANANPGPDIIVFSSLLSGEQLDLSLGQLNITDDLTIRGYTPFDSDANITISGGNTQRIFNVSSGVALTLDNLTLTAGAAGQGGAIYTQGSLTLLNSTIQNSAATSGGGGVYGTSTSTIVMTSSTLSANSSVVNGGALESLGSTTLTGVTFSGNSAGGSGGGVYATQGTLNVRNSTLTLNRSDSDNAGTELGGGLGVSTATVTLTSTLLSGNYRGPGVSIVNDIAGSVSGSNNLVGSASSAGGLVNGVNGNLIGAAAMLGPLAGNDGQVMTHELLAGSAAIDAGSNPAGLANDARGGRYARSFGSGIDIGAYERQSLTLVVSVLTDTENGNTADNDLSLREAISITNANPAEDTITFANGLSGTITLGGTALEVTDELTITGPGAELLTIDANAASRVFMVDDPDGALLSPVFLEGMTITGGVAAGSGGGILSLERLTLFEVVLTGNQAILGGGVYSTGTLIIADTTISNNTATDSGGGIALDTLTGASLTLARSLVTSNTAVNLGGGVLALGAASNVTIFDSTISTNTVSVLGGGGLALFNTGSFTLTNSTIADNSGGGTALLGAGLNLQGPTATITTSTIHSNTGSVTGGGLYLLSGSLVIELSTISGNTAKGDGGGLYLKNTTAQIYNSTLTLNIADSDNNAPSNDLGGGLYNDASTITLVSTIVAGNRNGAGSASEIRGSALQTNASTNNLIGSTSSSGGLSNNTNGNRVGVNALLGPLSLDGGTTATHPLLAGSPAINGGINPQEYALDQLGQVRLRGQGVDIGAREVSGIAPTTTVLADQASAVVGGTVTFAATPTDPDGFIQIVEFFWDANGNGVADAGEWISSDNNASDGWTGSFVVPDAVTAATGLVILAIAYDDENLPSATAVAPVVAVNALPTYGALTVSKPESARGGRLTFTLNDVADSDGTIRRVSFYLDANFNGVADDGELIRTDTSASGGYTASYTVPLTSALGEQAVIAVVTDSSDATVTTEPVTFFVTNIIPRISSLSTPTVSFGQGDFVTLIANGVTDSDGSKAITEVRFYIDTNKDGIPQPGELLGIDTTAGDGYRLTLTRVQTQAMATGGISFLAVAVDADGGMSNPAKRSANVFFSLLAQTGASVRGAASESDRLTVVTVNKAGDPLVFDPTTSTARQLAASLGAPPARDDLITWVDPKDGLTYAAYPATNGLILLARSSKGIWSFRNLTTELLGSTGPIRSLTQFVSGEGTGQVVVIAGVAANGDLVAYKQTGEVDDDDLWQYTFEHISDSLEEGGFPTPSYQSLISYRTAWDAWHLAGLDSEGNIVSVWTSPSVFTQWRTDNLSTSTGAPQLAGGLSVILTSWRGINLTGLNDRGEVVVTWWIPGFGGDWESSNLTRAFAGPTFVDNGLTGYYTSWDGMNYAGRDENGQIVIYWWVPSFGGQWSVSTITDIADFTIPRPSGQLTSLASSKGTLSLFGSSDNGDVIRAFWQPGQGGAWTLENLSADAKRA